MVLELSFWALSFDILHLIQLSFAPFAPFFSNRILPFLWIDETLNVMNESSLIIWDDMMEIILIRQIT